MYYGAAAPRSDVKERWFGLAMGGIAAQNIAVAEGSGLGARDVKKNALLASGAIFAAAALHHGYNIRWDASASGCLSAVVLYLLACNEPARV